MIILLRFIIDSFFIFHEENQVFYVQEFFTSYFKGENTYFKIRRAQTIVHALCTQLQYAAK